MSITILLAPSAVPGMVRSLENQSLGDAISCQESTLSYTFCCFSTVLIYFNVVPINSSSLKILFVSSGRGSFSPTSYVVPPYFYSRNDTGQAAWLFLLLPQQCYNCHLLLQRSGRKVSQTFKRKVIGEMKMKEKLRFLRKLPASMQICHVFYVCLACLAYIAYMHCSHTLRIF